MSNLPRYENPPLEEVAFGCQFRQLNNWFIPHTGKLWRLFEKDFPIVQHAQPIPDQSGFPPIDTTCGFPLPRVWFINSDESRLIQFQQNRFHYNWRKKDPDQKYPHYPEISKNFFLYFNLFKDFVSSNGIDVVQPERYELTYINHIYPEKLGSLFDTIKSLPRTVNLFYESDLLPTPKNVAWSGLYKLEHLNGELVIKLAQAKKVGTDDEFVRLEFTVSSADTSNMEGGFVEWFNQAHELIVKSFAEFSSEKIQKEIWRIN